METMKIIAKLSGKTVKDKCDGIFPDVDKKSWGCKYIEFAYRENLIAKNDLFRPNDFITKTESMKLILKAKNIKKTRITTNWQEDYMITAYEKGIIEEKYTDFNASALRGWIFATATSVVKKEIEEKIRIKKENKISGESL
ncbi:MAG: S-layer homology domain-containing protein [Candidatus Gracilibacteria bacterium]|nr:S-layer homology domain-containing protein [Candidatus Gracilibacteria bacterium]